MARPFRYQYAGAIYHITARGNERRAIFRDDHDRLRFLDKLHAPWGQTSAMDSPTGISVRSWLPRQRVMP